MSRIFMIFQDSENTVVYLDSDANLIGARTIRKWAEDCTDEPVNDVLEVKQEELQYYCIDGRVHVTEDDERELKERYCTAPKK